MIGMTGLECTDEFVTQLAKETQEKSNDNNLS